MRANGLLLGVGVLALAGCYESTAPLDAAPEHEIDRALLGTWRCLPSNPASDEEAASFVVASTSDRVYAISFEEGPGKEPERYEGFLSRIKDKPFLNVRQLKAKPSDKPWAFVRYAYLRPDVVQVHIVSDELLKDVEGSPESVRSALERHLEKPELLYNYCVCLRARD